MARVIVHVYIVKFYLFFLVVVVVSFIYIYGSGETVLNASETKKLGLRFVVRVQY